MSNVLTIEQTKKSLDQLYQIQTQSPPTINNLPKTGAIYNIDLNTRTIEAPKFLSVSRDHKAGVVYFKVDRFYDYMDLAETICLIQYIPPHSKEKIAHTYIVPFFDILSYLDEGKIIFPWVVGGAATQKEGDIQFAIRFYKTSVKDGKTTLVYNLNTAPATSKILYGLEADDEAMKLEYDIPLEAYESLINQLSNQRTTWTIL